MPCLALGYKKTAGKDTGCKKYFYVITIQKVHPSSEF